MSKDILLVKSTTSGSEAFFSEKEINGYNLTSDIPLPSIPVLTSWIESKGFSTDYFDLDRNDYHTLLEKAHDAEVIGFYLNYSGHFRVMDAVEIVKKTYPDKLVVIGGPSVMSLKEDFYKLSRSRLFGFMSKKPGNYVDAVVYGEGEIPLELILKHKDNPDEIGKLIDTNDINSQGIVYKDKNGELHVSDKPGIFPDLSLLPIPRFTVNKDLIPVAFIETSRGCAFKCPFCEMPGMYTTRKVKNQKQIEEEINQLQQLGYKHVIITDPAIYPSSRMDMLSELFAGRGMVWTGYARPGSWKSKEPIYQKDTLRKAHDSGCISLFFGGESACEKTQELYGKPNLDVLRETERVCKETGILSCWSFMILNPHETSKEVDKLIDLIIELKPAMCVFSPFTIMPDAEIALYPEKYGLKIIDHDYKLKAADLWAKFSNSAGADRKERIRKLILTHPRIMRFIIKLLLNQVNYFKSVDTGLGFADGAFEMLRVDSALSYKTNTKVGKTNYHLLFEMAAENRLTV
ncbi:B12-binding domain-containing radical SAM protein [Chloroflexota bacterium]